MTSACLAKTIRRVEISPRKATYGFRKIEARGELEEAFRLRHRVYCLEKMWLDVREYSSGIEEDPYDPFSVHFAAFSQDGDMVGTLRLIVEAELPLKLPVESHFLLGEDWRGDGPGGEVSRLVVAPGHRNGKVALGLFRIMYRYVRDTGLSNLYLVTEVPLLRLLDRLCFRFETIGEPAIYMGSTVTPARLDINRVAKEVRAKRPEVYVWFQEDPVFIDV